MSELDDLLMAFDLELAQFSTKNAVVRRFVATTAQKQRNGLERFYREYGRLPETVGELLKSDFAVTKMREYKWAFALTMQDDWPVRSYLAATERAMTGHPYIGDQTVRSLKLVHAVYRAHDPISQWRAAAAVLTKRGFSDEQISLIRGDASVRRACRRLMQPFNR